MSQVLETLMGSLGGDTRRRLSRALGAEESHTEQATGAALSTILGALQRNASRPEGAAALDRALEKDHDGSILDDLGGFLGNATAGSGDGILRHVLGDRRAQVERNLSRSTGLDTDKVGSLMTMLAPVVMGALGRQRRQTGMNATTLAGYLGRETQAMETSRPGSTGLVGKLLDADGDGDFDAGDALKHGAGLLGKFFKR